MTNVEICRLLRQVAASYSIKDEKKYRFQIIAYQKAADAIENSTTEVKELYKDNKLDNLAGVGPSIKSYLEELLKHGQVTHFEAILSDIPPAVFPLLDVPSFGPKKAFKLVTYFKLNNPHSVIADLREVAQDGKIANLEGFGEKSQKDILRALDEYAMGKTKTARMVLPYANELAEKILSYLLKNKAVLEAHTLGSLRRKMPTIGDIDIAVASKEPQKVIEYFASYPHADRVIEQGDRTSSILISSGRQVDLMVESPEGFGALLQHFTGSKAHNIHLREYALTKGLSLSDYGIRKKSDPTKKLTLYNREEKFYKALGMDWIPPEIREDTGEIELALKHKLPQLVDLADIKGDFHIHSNYPIEPSHDLGQSSMEVMVKKAISLNYDYLGFSEHNPSVSKHSSKQIYDILYKRNKLIDHVKTLYQKSIHIFSLLEIDILSNGDLAVDDQGLDLLDGAIVSIHSGFNNDRELLTKRVLKGLSHPKAKILAHPTGRLLNQRAGYELEWDKIFEFCAKNNKAIEINSWPLRLDLPDSLVRQALQHGVTLVIDTDSHEVSQMNMMEYGVSVARRGWAESINILNTKPYNEIKKWFEN